MFKKSILAIMIAVVSIGAFAQVDDVTLTVSHDGATKDEAKKMAIRDAMEQAYGTFVSANTVILNDELVKDEIVTVASGALKKYDELSYTILPNGNHFITLRVTVSRPGLIAYAQSKGASTEFAGQTFAMNIKLMELNKKNEETAILNMLEVVEKLVPNMFDYSLKLYEPSAHKAAKDNNHIGPVTEIDLVKTDVDIIITPNSTIIRDIIGNTLASLTMSDKEQADFKQANLKTYELRNVGANVKNYVWRQVQDENQPAQKKKKKSQPIFGWVEVEEFKVGNVVLRNDYSQHFGRLFNVIINYERFNFKIVDNLGGVSKPVYSIVSDVGVIPREVPPAGTTITLQSEDRFGRPQERDVVLNMNGVILNGSYTGLLCNRANFNVHSTEAEHLSRQPWHKNTSMSWNSFFPRISNSNGVCQDRYPFRRNNVHINDTWGTTLQLSLWFPQEDLSKYSNFEIMRDED